MDKQEHDEAHGFDKMEFKKIARLQAERDEAAGLLRSIHRDWSRLAKELGRHTNHCRETLDDNIKRFFDKISA